MNMITNLDFNPFLKPSGLGVVACISLEKAIKTALVDNQFKPFRVMHTEMRACGDKTVSTQRLVLLQAAPKEGWSSSSINNAINAFRKNVRFMEDVGQMDIYLGSMLLITDQTSSKTQVA